MRTQYAYSRDMRMFYAASALVCLTVAVSDLTWVFTDHPSTPVAPTAAVAPPAPVDPVGDRSMEIAIEVETVAKANPESRFFLSALFLSSGSMEVVFMLPPHPEWTEALREEVRDEVAAAIERGAIQFQLAVVPEDRGAIVEK